MASQRGGRDPVGGGERRTRGRSAAAALVAVAVVALTTVGCSSDDGDDTVLPNGTAATPVPTTTDPFAEEVVDACGNDLAPLTSTVWAIDPADGAVRWQAMVPLAENYLLRSADGDPQLALELRSVEVVLDADTGEIVDTPPAGAHEVLVDPSGATQSGVGGLLVDGEAQPAEIEVGGRRVTTAAGETGQTSVAVSAFDAGSAAPAWRAEVGAADQVASLSAPVLYGDVVVVVTGPPQPVCP
jgi:outer membrane protein assembly factor BamB